jgi:hypothetical protein
MGWPAESGGDIIQSKEVRTSMLDYFDVVDDSQRQQQLQ